MGYSGETGVKTTVSHERKQAAASEAAAS